MKTIILLLVAFSSFAQFQLVRQPDPTTVAALPTASTNTRRIYIVTDGTSASDCTTGGGSTRAICISNGTTWTATAGGAGSITGCGFGQTLNGTVCDTNTAVIPSQAILQSGAPLYCAGAGTAGAQTCSLSPVLTAYTNGMVVAYNPGTTNTTTQTINIDSLGAKSILTATAGALAAGDLTAGQRYLLQYDGTQFRLPASGSSAGTFKQFFPTGGCTITPVFMFLSPWYLGTGNTGCAFSFNSVTSWYYTFDSINQTLEMALPIYTTLTTISLKSLWGTTTTGTRTADIDASCTANNASTAAYANIGTISATYTNGVHTETSNSTMTFACTAPALVRIRYKRTDANAGNWLMFGAEVSY